jgi:hypothetical protein
MAINSWVTVTLSTVASKQPDGADHKHTAQPAGADGGGLTVAIDTAIVTTMTLFDSAVTSARKQFAARLPP